MFIWKETQKRCNPYTSYTDVNGTFYLVVPKELYEEVPEPAPPEDYVPEYYFVTEQDDAPYVVYTRKSADQIEAIVQAKAKAERQSEVEAIIVTTESGKQFDGDEISQGRMSRAINALEPLEATTWVLADNIVDVTVTREELKEALRLAGAAQTAIWTRPYV